ncbi:MAG: adenylate/guanylate cyclase domain-containing protein [Xanthobacteraceae bacterium]
MTDPAAHSHDEPFWRDVLSGRLRSKLWVRRLLRLISPDAGHRCHLCYAPFDGLAAPAMRMIGRGPWRRNPRYCDECERVFAEHRGGAEVELAVLYADVRGSTQMAARMQPTEFAGLMQRFFIAATKVLTAHGAVIDKMVGDEVIGIFMAGMVGPSYRRDAVRAGRDLLHATGHADAAGPWLPIGVGVHSGIAFVGSIGAEGGTSYEFAALGETMNTGARLVAAAGAGELVISEAVWPDVAGEVDAQPRPLTLKGIDGPVTAHVARVGSAPAA